MGLTSPTPWASSGPPPSDCGLRISNRTRDYAFIVNNLTPPAELFLVELRGPSGDTWSWGSDAGPAGHRVQAEDFLRLVTQRRAEHFDVNAVGRVQRWLTIAQAAATRPRRSMSAPSARREPGPINPKPRSMSGAPARERPGGLMRRQ